METSKFMELQGSVYSLKIKIYPTKDLGMSEKLVKAETEVSVYVCVWVEGTKRLKRQNNHIKSWLHYHF